MDEVIINQEPTPTETNYLEVIKNLKETTVDKSEYNKLVQENKNLLENYINGCNGQKEPEEPTYRPSKEISNELISSEHNNLQYISLALELRESLMHEGKPDPFLPAGSQVSPSVQDIEAANRCASIYKECVEYADGNSEVFTNELMRRTRDIKINR